MKTHDLADNLEMLAHLLRRMPNVDLDPKLASGLQGDLLEQGGEKRAAARLNRPLPDGLELKLSEMNAAEVEAYLVSDEDLFTAANLSELAARLKLPTSKRQSKSALINVIVRHLEASKMHSIIRSTKAELPEGSNEGS
ncbi:hypothetical protein [Pseudoxanthomonas sp. Root630]|uniref:hypothetical protein n=1 Tax=Pseudoxanthomonas sp. Root630 TaxID=1736574 RepID=UPI0007039EFD|nr:hypothetical protein [Pseudoxanthomonas sp. Root630]KRA41607.1 hypothetical protein ASD72_16215 [Pseudoxanthomonas sp. Root630]